MAKQELKWINVQATAFTGDMAKAWSALEKAKEAFKATVEANARKANALKQGERLQIALKPWGIGLAKATGNSLTISNGNMFSEL